MSNNDHEGANVDFRNFDTMNKSPSCIEIIPNILYWIANNKSLIYNSVEGCHIYNIDHKFSYKKFNKEQGPLHLGYVAKYI